MEATYNLEKLRDSLFARCKIFWGVGLVAKLLIFVCGALVVFLPSMTTSLALLGLILALLSEWLLWLSDRWKSASQQLHRKLDFRNSFGWEIKRQDILDFMARYAVNESDFISEPTGSYFASKQAPGPRRALENLRESSWWSLHLAEPMWLAAISTILVIVAGCILLLNVSVKDASQASGKVVASAQANVAATTPSPAVTKAVDASIAKVVTSAFLFVFSYGLFRFATGYFVFKEKARRISEKADQLLEKSEPDHIEAIKLWQEYHLAREASPTIPSWMWALREKKLNALWQRTYG